MKKTIAIIAVLLCIFQIAFAEVPELKNMMPNSWQKLTRLSEAEEREFFQREEVKNAILEIDDYSFNQKKIKEINYEVFTETNSGLQFYRLLMCVNPLDSVYNRVYNSGLMKKADYSNYRSNENCIWQIVFLKKKNNLLQNIKLLTYSDTWASQGDVVGFDFNDLMIKILNKNEIGFFFTEVSVSYTPKEKNNNVSVIYSTCKNQLDASNRTWFSKYKIGEDIKSAWSKDGINIQASDCLFDPKSPLKYSIQNAFDGNPATSYVENTEDDMFEIKIHIRQYNPTFAVINGYSLTKELYRANNRIKIFNYNYLLEDDNLNYQIINGQGNAYFKVKSIYKGEKYNDSCISELNVKFDKSLWLFGEMDE